VGATCIRHHDRRGARWTGYRQHRDARALAPKLFPAAVSPATSQALANADSPGQALALLLVAPEFMRR